MSRNIKIKQHDMSDCGAACIASICSYYGKKIPIIKIREACGTDSEGTTLKGVIDASTSIGFTARAYKSTTKDIDTLFKVPLPTILHFRKEDGWLHYVVLYKIDKKGMTVMDPEEGKIIKIPHQRIKELWTGYVIVMIPSSIENDTVEHRGVWLRLYSIVKQNKQLVKMSLEASVMYMVLSLSTSLFLQQLIDKILPMQSTGYLLFIIASMIIIMISTLAIGYYRGIFTLRNTITLNSTFVLHYIRSLFRMPVSFFRNRSQGEINARLGDAFKIGGFLSTTFISLIISIVTLFLSLIVLFIFNIKLALATMAFIPFYAILYYFTNKVNRVSNKRVMESAASFEEVNIRNLSSIENSIYYGCGDYMYRQAERSYVSMSGNIYDGGCKMIGFSIGSDAITRSLSISVLFIGSIFIFNMDLTIGELISFFTITGFFSAPLMNLINSSYEMSEAKIAAERVFEITDYKEDKSSVISINNAPPTSGDIEFSNVNFGYNGREKLFENISFTIPKDSITSIWGNSGSGKSTIASLLMRSYLPTDGKIKMNNIDINSFEVTEWRTIITIVPQKPQLFNRSLLENITLNDREADLNRIISLCDQVGLTDLIDRLPTGLMTAVGENGAYLSGGEQQRIAIARALYRSPEILILDEPVSSLDRTNRESIYSLIKKLKKAGKTVILISHDREVAEISDYSIEIDKLKCTQRSTLRT